jgi:soluble lytic murein transglycosylase-like protein
MTLPLFRSFSFGIAAATLFFSAASAAEKQHPASLDPLIARYAHRHGIPEHLLHRLIAKESGYNAAACTRRYYGLMQITYATARGMGYHGAPRGLLDPEINLTYGVPYLANAYRLSGGSEARALRLYSSGYYDTAKRRHMLSAMRTAASPSVETPASSQTVSR